MTFSHEKAIPFPDYSCNKRGAERARGMRDQVISREGLHTDRTRQTGATFLSEL